MAAAEIVIPLMEEDDEEHTTIKNDFAYHNNVAGAPKHVRMGFIRKVYSLLSIQLAVTTVVAATCLLTPQIKELVHDNPAVPLLTLVLSLCLLLVLFVKRRETPMNLVLLAAFTVTEALTVGAIVTFYEAAVVLQAFMLTLGAVAGLTAFTFQSKKDFSHWGTGLLAGLWILIMGGFMHALVGGEIAHTALSVFGALIFSGFIVFDTHMIMTRLNPEEYILATIELYLDIINLFIEILKIMEKVNRR